MATPGVELLLIRHGETEGNVARVSQGVTDSPLTARGQAQVRKLGQHMASRFSLNGGDKPTVHLFLASPLGRTMRTAQGLLRAWGHRFSPRCAPVEADDCVEVVSKLVRCWSEGRGMYFTDRGLMERSFGAREGFCRGARVHAFEGGRGAGETNAEFTARVKHTVIKWVDMALKACQDMRQESGTKSASCPGTLPESSNDSTAPSTVRIVMVTHGLWIKQFAAVFVPHGLGGSAFLTNTSITAFNLLPPTEKEGLPTEPPAKAGKKHPADSSAGDVSSKRQQTASDSVITTPETKVRRTLLARRELPLILSVVGANQTPHLQRNTPSRESPSARQSSLHSFLRPKR